MHAINLELCYQDSGTTIGYDYQIQPSTSSMSKWKRNNKIVTELSVSELVPSWDCQVIIHDIHKAGARGNISFHWTTREANRVAQWIAVKNLKGLLSLDWAINPSAELSALLFADAV